MIRVALLLVALAGCSSPAFEVGEPLRETPASDASDAPAVDAPAVDAPCVVPDGAGWCDLAIGGCEFDPVTRCMLRSGWVNKVPACGGPGLVVVACIETAEGCSADTIARVQSCR